MASNLNGLVKTHFGLHGMRHSPCLLCPPFIIHHSAFVIQKQLALEPIQFGVIEVLPIFLRDCQRLGQRLGGSLASSHMALSLGPWGNLQNGRDIMPSGSERADHRKITPFIRYKTHGLVLRRSVFGSHEQRFFMRQGIRGIAQRGPNVLLG